MPYEVFHIALHLQSSVAVQERHVHALLEGAAEEHMVRLRGITQRAADQAASDARFKELQHVDEVGSASLRQVTCCQTICEA